jgi:DNA-binding PadR family transcriptional regulator
VLTVPKPTGPPGGLTITSYAFLGLLAIRPATAYELAKQVKSGMGRFWPRTTSKLYEEPKKLVRLGLASAAVGSTGRRPHTRYSITAAGRSTLADWMSQPSQLPGLQSEHLMKVYFAEHGSRADLLATLAGVREWAEDRGEEIVATARAYQDGVAQQPDRMAQLMLLERLLIDVYEAIDDWARWATAVVEEWPSDLSDAGADHGALRETARRSTRPGAALTSAPTPRLLLTDQLATPPPPPMGRSKRARRAAAQRPERDWSNIGRPLQR